MRGIEAINVIILIVLAVITLLAVVILFMGVVKTTNVNLQAATQSACLKLRDLGCLPGYDLSTISVENFDADKDGKLNGAGDTLSALCQNYYGCVLDSMGSGSNFQNCCSVRICSCSS